jgi:hypothetical protein
MTNYQFQHIFSYPPERVFAIFRKQIRETFPSVNLSNPIGTATEKKAKGVQGYTFILQLEISDYKENEAYELTTHASNRQSYVSRYELQPLPENKTQLVLTEENTTPGFWGNANTLLSKMLYKKWANRKAEHLFQGIESELVKLAGEEG